MEINRIKVTLSTDGACSGNPGPGGYACVLRCGNNVKEISGYNPKTTNNRMELTAVIEGVKVLKKPCIITVRTDSQYVCNGIANAKERSQNGWHTKSGAKCANSDLWMELQRLRDAGNHRFQYLKVEGHSGDKDNERCDRLAKNRILARQSQTGEVWNVPENGVPTQPFVEPEFED